MSDDREKQLAELRQLHEKGLLSAAAYQAAIAGIKASYQAQVQSGAAAQGEGATAVGAGGVFVGGNVQGGIYVGEPAQDPAEALRIYRDVLVRSSGHLPLRGVDVGASDPTIGQKPLGLANVYVDLNTTTQVEVAGSEKARGERHRAVPGEERETRPLPALEAAANNRRLILLGDPGGGKSTFVTHLAYCLAGPCLATGRRLA